MNRWNVMIAMLVVLTLGCGDGQLSTNGYDSTATTGAEEEMSTDDSTSTTNNGSTDPGTTQTTQTTGTETNNATTGVTNNVTTPTTNNSTTGTNGETSGGEFHPMFVAVADFMREKCINCHSEGQNGNLQIASADASNAEVQTAVEGVEATTGRLLVEPFDPDQSQVYIMITNAAGEQFDAPTIAIVEDWINAGAPYVQ